MLSASADVKLLDVFWTEQAHHTASIARVDVALQMVHVPPTGPALAPAAFRLTRVSHAGARTLPMRVNAALVVLCC